MQVWESLQISILSKVAKCADEKYCDKRALRGLQILYYVQNWRYVTLKILTILGKNCYCNIL